MTDRVVVLIDMDCFYCQVESRLNPSLNGKPMAVVQYNQWKGGGIIAVNYEARDRGVTRHMRGKEAKEHCPEIILVTVPTVRDKADLTRYRDAGREVLAVFCRFSDCVQRASIDEAYIDLTSVVEERMKTFSHFDFKMWNSTYVVGYSTDGSNDEGERQNGMKSWLEDSESIDNTPSLKLAVGAIIVEEMREAVLAVTGFKCSAGIAHNKILAKLACGIHKPNRQTILPQESVKGLFTTLSIKKIRSLGGKFGDDVVEKLGCKTMSDLLKYSERDLQNRYDEKSGSWLYNIARGFDYEPVTARLVSKSIGCCKKFPGKQALMKSDDVYHWLNKLAEELSERLLEDETINKRKAQLLTVSTAIEINRVDNACSKSISMSSYHVEKIVSQAESLLKKICKIDSSGTWSPPIKYMGLSAGKFSQTTTNKIDKFFKTTNTSENSSAQTKNIENETKNNNSNVEETKMSFFEKVFAKNLSDSAKKLQLVPDLTKNDLLFDSDDSQSSATKFKKGNISSLPSENMLRDSIKKNLFTPSALSEKTSHPFKTKIESQRKESEKNDNTKNIKRNCSDSSLASFFGKTSKNESWTKLEELFPDINQVDDELLSLLPQSYRNKILKMKNDNTASSAVDLNTNVGNCSDLPSIIDNCDNLKARTEKCDTSVSIRCSDASEMISDCTDIKEMHTDFSHCNEVNNDCSSSDKIDIDCVDTNEVNNGSSVTNEMDNDCSADSKDRYNLNTSDQNESPSTSAFSISDEHLVKCDECGEKVFNYELHMDMHMAKKLHKELNSFSTVSTKKVLNSNEKDKKKRRNNIKPLNENTKKMKSIATFFSKK